MDKSNSNKFIQIIIMKKSLWVMILTIGCSLIKIDINNNKNKCLII